ncbi:unnamed protein product, partial [Brassica rapa subsp. narinosa]
FNYFLNILRKRRRAIILRQNNVKSESLSFAVRIRQIDRGEREGANTQREGDDPKTDNGRSFERKIQPIATSDVNTLPYHRRAHSEVQFRLPEDLDLSEPFGGFEDLGSEDDLSCSYMDIEKLGSGSDSAGPSALRSDNPFPEAGDSRPRHRHRHSLSVDGGSSTLESIEAKKAMARDKLAELWVPATRKTPPPAPKTPRLIVAAHARHTITSKTPRPYDFITWQDEPLFDSDSHNLQRRLRRSQRPLTPRYKSKQTLHDYEALPNEMNHSIHTNGRRNNRTTQFRLKKAGLDIESEAGNTKSHLPISSNSLTATEGEGRTPSPSTAIELRLKPRQLQSDMHIDQREP